MRIVIAGAGAIGGYIGARLAKAGSDVVLQVAREKETMQVRIPSADRSRLLKAPLLH